jgi:hypothetical protein
MLILFDDGNGTGLLHLTIETAEQVFGRFFGVFAGHLYHG